MVDCPDLHVRDNQAINCNNLDFNAQKYLSRMIVPWCFPHKFQVSNMSIFLGGFYGTSQLKAPQVEMTEVIREIEQAELMLGAVTMCISIPLKSPSSPWFLGCVSYCNIGGVAFNPLQETVDPRKTWVIWAPNGPQEDARCHRLHAEFTIPPVLPSGGFLGRAGSSRTAQGDQNHCENWGKNRTKLSVFFIWGISCRCSPKLCSICLRGLAVSQNWGSLAIGFPSEWPILDDFATPVCLILFGSFWTLPAWFPHWPCERGFKQLAWYHSARLPDLIKNESMWIKWNAGHLVV